MFLGNVFNSRVSCNADPLVFERREILGASYILGHLPMNSNGHVMGSIKSEAETQNKQQTTQFLQIWMD